MTKESRYLLQNVDCNCNDCIFLYRDANKKIPKGVFSPILYGWCSELKKGVSFIANICQLETQKCFYHRLDALSEKELNERFSD